MWYMGRLSKTLLVRVNLPLIDRYYICQAASLFSNSSMTPLLNSLDLNLTTKGSLRYVVGKESVLQHRISANSCMLGTSFAG